MENLSWLLKGFQVACAPENILMAGVGAVLGIIVGATPGIGSLVGTALLLPITFKMNPSTAIIMLAAIYYANMYGGAFSAILLNIPGDSPAIMTALDGYPMTRKNQAGKALLTADLSSFIGGAVGAVILTFLGPALARIGLKFGPTEMVAVMLLALTSIGWLIGDSPFKGLVSTLLGMLLASIGLDTAQGVARFTAGNINLLSGLQLVPLVIGMFGFSQIMELMAENDVKETGPEDKKLRIRDSLPDKNEMKRLSSVAARSGVLGNFIGVLPGAGATIAAFISYIFNKAICKNGDEFGTGVVEGIAASEGANNGAAIGAFAPLLALGIPGSGTTAVLLGGLMMWGLTPGPQLFTNQPEFVWGLISSMYLGNIICLVLAILCIPFLVKLITFPKALLAPVITVLCVVGSFSATNNMFNVYVMIIAGIAGYFLKKADFPSAPILLSFVLMPTIEKNLFRSLQISQGSFSIFLQKPITLAFLICIVMFMICPPVIKAVKKKKYDKK